MSHCFNYYRSACELSTLADILPYPSPRPERSMPTIFFSRRLGLPNTMRRIRKTPRSLDGTSRRLSVRGFGPLARRRWWKNRSAV
jgi:hypothetical protein